MCCLSFDGCSSWFVVCRWSFVSYRVLSAAVCCLLFVGVCCLMWFVVVCCLWFVVCCCFVFSVCLLFSVLFVVRCVSFVVCGVLSVVL